MKPDWVAINRRGWTEERRLKQRETMRRLYRERALAEGKGETLNDSRRCKHRARQARYRDRLRERILQERECQRAT
jgi:hypothetical protein